MRMCFAVAADEEKVRPIGREDGLSAITRVNERGLFAGGGFGDEDIIFSSHLRARHRGRDQSENSSSPEPFVPKMSVHTDEAPLA